MEDLFTIIHEEEIIDKYTIESSKPFPSFCEKTMPYAKGEYEKTASAEHFKQRHNTEFFKLGTYQSLSKQPILSKLNIHQPAIFITVCDSGNIGFSQNNKTIDTLVDKQVTIGYNSPSSFGINSTGGFSNHLVIAIDTNYIIESRENYALFKPIINRLIEKHISPKALSVFLDDSDPIIKIADQIRTCMATGSKFLNNTLSNLVHELIESILTFLNTHTLAMKIHQYIEEHFRDHDKTHLKEILTYAGISYSTLERIYDPVFKSTAANYVNRLRMEEVLHLITQKGYTVSEAYTAVGFPHDKNFARRFKRFHQFLPSQIPAHFYEKS